MMRRVLPWIAAGLALIAGVAVMQLKFAVQEKADDVAALAQTIRRDREAIRVLDAEWTYLTSPARLQDQSLRFLALMPPKPEQIVGNPTVIPFRPRGLEAPSDPGVMRDGRDGAVAASETYKKTKGQRP